MGGVGNVSSGSKKNWFQYLLSIFSIGLAAMMCCLGVFGIIDQETSATDIAEIFVSLYMIFIAFLVIGLKDDVSVQFLRYMTGGCFLGTGVLMLFIYFTKPDLLSSYESPTAGFGGDVNTPV